MTVIFDGSGTGSFDFTVAGQTFTHSGDKPLSLSLRLHVPVTVKHSSWPSSVTYSETSLSPEILLLSTSSSSCKLLPGDSSSTDLHFMLAVGICFAVFWRLLPRP